MPRLKRSDPLALAIGQRIRALREQAGLTMEKLAYESDLGSKGHLSSLERGLVRPTVHTLQVLADRLGVELLDIVTFPERGVRHALVDRTRGLTPGSLRRLLGEIPRTAPTPVASPKPRRPVTRRRAAPARRR